MFREAANRSTFSGRAGDDHFANHEDRDARPVRCNGRLSRVVRPATSRLGAFLERIALQFQDDLGWDEATSRYPDEVLPAATFATHHAQQPHAVNEA